MVNGRGLGFRAHRVKGLRLRAIGLGPFLRPNQIHTGTTYGCRKTGTTSGGRMSNGIPDSKESSDSEIKLV